MPNLLKRVRLKIGKFSNLKSMRSVWFLCASNCRLRLSVAALSPQMQGEPQVTKDSIQSGAANDSARSMVFNSAPRSKLKKKKTWVVSAVINF